MLGPKLAASGRDIAAVLPADRSRHTVVFQYALKSENIVPFRSLVIPLQNEVHYILDRYFHRQPFDRSQIPEIRGAIDKVVAEWKAANRDR